jgi:predicted aspartyl protease
VEHLEAIDQLEPRLQRDFEGDDTRPHRKQDRVKVLESDDSSSQIKNQLAEMRNALNNVRAELKKRSRSLSEQRPKYRHESESRAPDITQPIVNPEPKITLPPQPTASINPCPSCPPPTLPTSEPSEAQARTPYERKCYRCKAVGHVGRNCPKNKKVQKLPQTSDTRNNAKISSDQPKGRVYINITAITRHTTALLDTGCAHSICGKNVIPRAELEQTGRKMFTASGASIPILGETTIYFQIEGQRHQARVAVTDALSEIILGIDWIEKNVRNWDFETSKVNVQGTWVTLSDGDSYDRNFKITVAEDVIVPA